MSPALAFAFLGFFVLFCLPGLSLGWWLWGRDARRHPEGIVYGLLFGHFVSSGLVVGLVALVGFSVWSLVLFVVVAGGAMLLALRHGRPAPGGRLRLPAWDGRAWVLFLVLLVVAAALIAEPLGHVGKRTPEGYAYRKYFIGDFLKEVAVTAELAKGEVPPQNPWFAGETLRYYWWHFVAPAAFSRLVGGAAELKTVLVLNTAVTDALFLFVLFSTLRLFTAGPLGPFLAALLGVAAYSYEGAWLWWLLGEPLHGFVEHARGYNVDGLTRWLWGDPQLDGFFRSLLYTPQHLESLALLLAVVAVNAFGDVPGDLPLAALTGLMVGASFGYSPYIGGLLALWHGLHQGIRWLASVRSRRALGGLLVDGGVAAVLFGLFWALGMFSLGAEVGLMVYTGNALRSHGLLVFLMNYGPPCVFGILGVALLWLERRRLRGAGAPGSEGPPVPVGPLLLLLVLAVGLIWTVAVPGVLSQVGLKLGLVVLAVLLVFTAAGLEIARRRLRAPAFYALLAVVAGPALVTVFVDRINSADVHNHAFTLYVSREEMQAAAWIRRHAPARAVVQSSSPDLRVDYFTLIPIFGERRTAVGDSFYARLFEVSPAAVEHRKRDIARLFETDDAGEALAIAGRYRIAYLYVGEREKRAFPHGVRKFHDHPEAFERVYANAQVELFRVSLSAS